jgi:hypothetical protein
VRRASSALPVSLLPFGVNREQAAAVIGVSPTTFDQMVADGRMPQPRVPSKKRYVWDLEELGEAFRRLPHRDDQVDGESRKDNPWDRG